MRVGSVKLGKPGRAIYAAGTSDFVSHKLHASRKAALTHNFG